MNKDSTEFKRLYKRLSALADKRESLKAIRFMEAVATALCLSCAERKNAEEMSA